MRLKILSVSLFIISIGIIVYLIAYPVSNDKFSMEIDNVKHNEDMFEIFNSNYLAPIIDTKYRGIHNIYISYADKKNIFTEDNGGFNQYLEGMKDNGKRNSFFEELHQRIRGHDYSKNFYGKNKTKFPGESKFNMLQLHNLTKNHFKFKSYLNEIANDFIESYNDDYKIGIDYTQGDYNLILDQLDKIFQNDKKSYKILLVTENNSFNTKLNQSKYKKYIIMYNNDNKTEKGIINCLLLSKCDYLIKTRNDLSNLSLVLNPHLPCSFISSDKEIYTKKLKEYTFNKIN